MSISAAFNAFMGADFEQAVDTATKAEWGNDRHYIELFPDGSYRQLSEVGNLYDSPGLILTVPALSEDEWDDDPALRIYDSAEDYIRNAFESAMDAIEQA